MHYGDFVYDAPMSGMESPKNLEQGSWRWVRVHGRWLIGIILGWHKRDNDNVRVAVEDEKGVREEKVHTRKTRPV